MLNHNERRPAFDAWFAKLDNAEQTVVLACAHAQYANLVEVDSPDTSFIDCLENIWDEMADYGISAVSDAYFPLGHGHE